MNATIRKSNDFDCNGIPRLLADLGYSVDSEQVRSRLIALREWPHQEAFVTELAGAVVGLCQVQGVRLLASDGYAEVLAVVVSADHHSRQLKPSEARSKDK